MRRGILCSTVILTIACHSRAQMDMKSLIAETQPQIQDQIQKVYDYSSKAARGEFTDNCMAFEEIQALKDMADDKGEIVKQLAIFVATTESSEDLHLFAAGTMLKYLDLPASIPIRVLAPYVDAENEKLRSFARGWFQQHDSNDRVHGRPPLGSLNYYDYMQYVRKRLERNEDIPAGFIKYIYEKDPGKGLLVFAHSYIDFSPAHRHRHLRRGMELSERIVSNAIWLNENEFAERFEAALPEANAELAKLAKHEEWWARLYVIYIMRQNHALLKDKILRQLAEDENQLVSQTAKGDKK